MLEDAARINPLLVEGFALHADDADNTRTHFFRGRYENIYIAAEKLPALEPVMTQARAGAAQILAMDPDVLRVGCWFNAMAPGDVTLPHCHDEEDELLSAVYYVEVPGQCGELIIHDGARRIPVTPQAGMFVYFPPAVVHEVTENRSDRVRLSLGINFGAPRDACD